MEVGAYVQRIGDVVRPEHEDLLDYIVNLEIPTEEIPEDVDPNDYE